MAKIYFATGNDGTPLYRGVNDAQWAPLEDGITEIQSSQGERLVWSQAAGDFIPVATHGDNLKAGTNDVLLAGNAILTQLGLASDESLAEHTANPIIPQRVTAPSPEMTQAMKEAGDSYAGIAKAILTNPLDVALPMLERSAPGMVATAIPAVLTAPIGGVGGLPGAAVMAGAGIGIGSFGVNQGSKYNEVLQSLAQQAGVDTNNPTTYAQFVNSRLQDGSLVKDVASQQATAYAGPVAVADALGAAVAGPAGKIIEDAARAGRIGVAAGMTGANILGQGVAGAGGEALGQVNQTGSIYDKQSVVAEGALEAIGAPGEIFTLHQAIKRIAPEEIKAIVETPVTQQEIQAVQESPGPKITREEATLVLDTLRTQGVDPQVTNSWSPEQFKAVANRLTVAAQRVPNQSVQAPPVGEEPQALALNTKKAAVKYLVSKGIPPELIQKATPEQLVNLGKQVQAKSLEQTQNRSTVKESEAPRQLTAPPAERPLLLGAPKPTESLTVPARATQRDVAVSKRATELTTQRLQELKKKPSATQATKIRQEAFKQASQELPVSKAEETSLPIVGSKGSLLLPSDVRSLESSTPEIPQELKLIQEEQRAKEAAKPRQAPEQVSTEEAPVTQEVAPEGLTLNDYLADLPTRTPRKFSAFIDAAFGTNPLNGADLTNVVDYTKQFKALQQKQSLARDQRLVMGYTDKVLNDTLAKYGLTGKVDPLVSLERLANGAGGYVEGKTLVIAALQPQGRSIESTINHEVVHALKNLGLFTPGEWNILKKYAPEWATRYGINSNPAYAELTPDEVLEEAIAEHFAQSANVINEVATKDTGLVNKLGKRIADFFTQLKNWVESALGVSTPEEVLRIFDGIMNGEIGSRTNEIAKRNLAEVRKYSKDLEDRVDDGELLFNQKIAVEPLRRLKKIGFLGNWFSDLANVAAKFPAVTEYYTLVRQQKALALDIRVKTQDAVRFLSDKHYKTGDRKIAFNKAAAFANINNEKLVYPEDGKPLTITLNKDYGAFKAGESVTLSGREVADLKSLEDSYKGIARQHILAIQRGILSSLSKSEEEGGLGIDFIEKFGVEPSVDDISKASEEYAASGNKVAAENLKVLADTVRSEMFKLREFYIPQMRTSPYFMDIYEVVDNKELGERVSVIAMPTGMLGGRPSSLVEKRFTEKRLNELKKANPDKVFTYKARVVNIKDTKGLTNNHLSTFERMAETLKSGKSEDVSKFLSRVRQELGTRGFKAQWTNRQDVPGWIHGDNLEGYLEGATGLYGHRAGNSISSAWYSPSINKELAKLETAVEGNTLDESVLKYVREHQEYLNSPQNEFDELRKIAFFYYLGFNPSSALLNGFQLLHSSLPVMTAMFGGSLHNLTSLSKHVGTAAKFLTADVAADNIFKDTKPNSISQEIWDLIQDLRQEGVVREVVTEEMSAKAGFVGGATDKERYIKGIVHKAGNVGTSMFSRMEALIRIATAISAFEEAKKISSDIKATEKLRKYISTTQYRNEELTPRNIAKIAVELSQFDTTRYNRAKALRGKMALPTQFLGFPLKMIQLYSNLLVNAFGSRNANGEFSFSIQDSTTKAAFATMFLGLMATSGILGAIPFGAAGSDGFDKLYKFLTGVDPDIEKKMRELAYDMTGSSMFTDAMFSGFINELTKADIGNRVGLQVFNTFNTETSFLDILGPTGGLITGAQDAYERVNQGHSMLALSTITVMPAILRNAAKAYYEGEYGIVTRAGDIVPTDYSPYESALQTIGFTPKRLSNTRDIIYQQQRDTERNTVAKERYTDALVALRVKETLARRKGDQEGAQSYRDEYKQLLASILEVNRGTNNPVDKIRLNLDTVQERYKAQVNAAINNKVNQRRVPKNLRGNLANIKNTYGSSYIE